MEPITMLTMFAPAIADAFRAVVNKWTGGDGAKPANTKEAIELMEADIRRIEAIAAADKVTGQVSLWVNNVRAMMRPTSTAVVLLSWIVLLVVYGDTNPEQVINISSNLASAAVFYIFGDRSYMHFKTKAKSWFEK